MRIEAVIGRRMAEIRESASVTQGAFGEQLAAVLGRSWTRQQVWNAENGRRAFTAAELVAVAYTLEVPLAELLQPPQAVEYIDLPEGGSIAVGELFPSPDLPPWFLTALRRLQRNAEHRARLEDRERELLARLIALFDERPDHTEPDEEADEEVQQR